jgi:hypothetical protein
MNKYCPRSSASATKPLLDALLTLRGCFIALYPWLKLAGLRLIESLGTHLQFTPATFEASFASPWDVDHSQPQFEALRACISLFGKLLSRKLWWSVAVEQVDHPRIA